MQGRINDGTEKGQESWRQTAEWLNRPPARLPRALGSSRAAQIRAEQEALVGDQVVAFERYAGRG